VNYLDPEDKSDEFIDITKDDLIAIEKLSKEPLIQKKIARSVAPPIYGRDDLKMACALSLFGGSRRRKPGGGFKRGDIHVLFVGDPGTGKSIHGSEKIYIGKDTPIGTMWKTEKIGDFANKMLNDNKSDIILKGDTEILRLLKHSSFYTYSINPDTLKTQKSKINEISRHKTNILVNIKTESGRVILTTLNHSFTTLLNGKLKVIDANDLIENFENIYLPVARNLNFRENFDCINFSNIINKENLVEAAIIRRQIQLYHNREITLSQAAKKSNITEGTFLSYMRDLNSIPNGDWIRSKYDNTWIPRKIKLDDKFGRIIGFYLAEGDIPKNSVRISNTDQEIIRILENDIKKIFHRVSYYDYDDSIQVHNASLRSWFSKYFKNKAQNKRIPSILLSTPSKFRLALISAYFTGDSYIDKKALFISATTASKMLAYSISDLLSTFGIFSTIKKKIIKSGKYKGNIYYEIILTGEEVIKFHQEIGYISLEKQQNLEIALFNAISKTRYQKNDIIPNFGNILPRIAKDIGMISFF
jgi:replicative DNA helicase Mcm